MNILSAGLCFGQAEALLHFFGEENPLVQTRLVDASNNLVASEALFIGPFASDRQRNNTLDERLREIDNFNRLTGRSDRRLAGYVRNIYGRYKQGLEYIYTSDQPGYYRKQANCDSKFLEVGYHFGRGSIAASVDSQDGRFYKLGAIQMMQRAIRSLIGTESV